MKCIWLDTETTGLDPIKNGIIQLSGLIEIDGEIKESFDYDIKPFPEDEINEESLSINGKTKEQILNDPAFLSPYKVYEDFKGILGKYVDKYNKNDKFTPMGQNVQFDLNFLRNFFIKNNDKYFGSFIAWQEVDLLAFARLLRYTGKISVDNCKLETLAKYIGKEYKAHDALEDIRMTREILKELIKRHIS